MGTTVYRAQSSSGDEEAHPVSAVLAEAQQRKRNRSRTPVKQGKAKRARKEALAEPSAVERADVVAGSRIEDPDEELEEEVVVLHPPEALVPVGVTVLAEGAAVDPSLQRRAPRSVTVPAFCASDPAWPVHLIK